MTLTHFHVVIMAAANPDVYKQAAMTNLASWSHRIAESCDLEFAAFRGVPSLVSREAMTQKPCKTLFLGRMRVKPESHWRTVLIIQEMPEYAMNFILHMSASGGGGGGGGGRIYSPNEPLMNGLLAIVKHTRKEQTDAEKRRRTLGVHYYHAVMQLPPCDLMTHSHWLTIGNLRALFLTSIRLLLEIRDAHLDFADGGGDDGKPALNPKAVYFTLQPPHRLKYGAKQFTFSYPVGTSLLLPAKPVAGLDAPLTKMTFEQIEEHYYTFVSLLAVFLYQVHHANRVLTGLTQSDVQSREEKTLVETLQMPDSRALFKQAMRDLAKTLWVRMVPTMTHMIRATSPETLLRNDPLRLSLTGASPPPPPAATATAAVPKRYHDTKTAAVPRPPAAAAVPKKKKKPSTTLSPLQLALKRGASNIRKDNRKKR